MLAVSQNGGGVVGDRGTSDPGRTRRIIGKRGAQGSEIVGRSFRHEP